MSITSTECALLYLMSMWPNRHFWDTSACCLYAISFWGYIISFFKSPLVVSWSATNTYDLWFYSSRHGSGTTATRSRLKLNRLSLNTLRSCMATTWTQFKIEKNRSNLAPSGATPPLMTTVLDSQTQPICWCLKYKFLQQMKFRIMLRGVKKHTKAHFTDPPVQILGWPTFGSNFLT